jgi:glycosyltransferase involved in cell wall biosynthesis
MQTGERLAVHYASGDVLLFPSLSETFGNITLEGMASGLATVAFDYAAARQHIRHGVDGMTAPVGDEPGYLACVEALARDTAFVTQLRAEARRSAECIGPRRVHADLERLLREHAGKVIDVAA